MNESIFQNKKALAILSIGTITILASMAVSPALASIKTNFYWLSDNIIQLVLVIPTFFIIPACFLSKIFCQNFGNKKTLITGLVLYLIGGVFAGFTNNFYVMLVFRAILGIGCGLILPLAQKLISDNFSGEFKERIIAYPASASCLMGIISAVVVGYIASIYWRLVFGVYLMALVVLYLNLRYLPDDKPKHIKPVDFDKKSLTFVLGMIFSNSVFYTFPTYIALFMKAEHIGNDASSGVVASCMMLAGFVSGIIAIHIRHILKNWSIFCACLLFALAYLLMANAHTILALCLCAVWVGLSSNILYSEIFSAVNKYNADLIPNVTASMFIGQTLSVPFLELLGFILNTNSYRLKFFSLSLCILILTLLIGFMMLKRHKKYLNPF